MTARLEVVPADAAAVRRSAIVQLAWIECSRMLTRAPIVAGFVVSVASALGAALASNDWQGQKYGALVPLSVLPLWIGTFVAGVRSGNRDRSLRWPPLSEEAPLDGDDRTLARLASLIVPVTMAALLMVAVGVVSRIEGGFWVGETPHRNDRALHSVFELLQPALIVAVVGAAAVAIGRAVRRSGPPIVMGVVLLFLSGGAYWMWNSDPLYVSALMQVQPLEFGTHEFVHTPTVILHDLYLLGLLAVFSGLSLRNRSRRRLVAGGGSVVLVAVVAQLVVSPF
jgi:hypothetical protein